LRKQLGEGAAAAADVDPTAARLRCQPIAEDLDGALHQRCGWPDTGRDSGLLVIAFVCLDAAITILCRSHE